MRTALKIIGWIMIPELMLIDAILTCYQDWKEILGYGRGEEDAETN